MQYNESTYVLLVTLKLDPVRYVPDAHRVVPAEDDFLTEGFYAVLEVPGSEEDIPPHHLVLRLLDVVLEVFIPGYFDSLLTNTYFDPRHVLARLIDLVQHLAVEFLKLWCEVGAPPHVASSEGEEDLKAKNRNIAKFIQMNHRSK